MDSPTETTTNGRPRRFIKRPDDSAFNKEIEELKNEIKKLDLSANEVSAQLQKVVTEPALAERRKELQGQLRELISKQNAIKGERNAIMDQIKAVDAQIKRKLSEIQTQTSKHNFKSVGEIDKRIAHLDSLVEAGDLKLAEEKRYVMEMSQLRKVRKDFGAVEKTQESIDADKAKVAELKKKLGQVQNREIQAQFEKIQAELDELNKKNQGVSEKRNELFKKRTQIRKSKDEKYDRIRKLNADKSAEFAKFKQEMEEEKKKRAEEARQHLQEEKRRKRKENAEKQLADASVPAFTAEISAIHNLLSYFDPSYVKPQPKAQVAGPKSEPVGTPTTIRKVEMPADLVVVKKEQEEFFAGSKGKKSKGKKAKSKNFTVDPEVIVSLGDLAIPLPTKSEDVPETIATLKETLTALEGKQEEQTKINIERAKERIAKLEAEEAEEAEEETSS
ncbi:Nuclear segregation protein BFR1 [Meyerozyma sp. JA9]|nr:Nuclear segregation protein BFR1 [Meyerozyma sp. JA9]